MLYIRFDPTSPNPQYANLRNIEWSSDPEQQVNLADNHYWSFREVYFQEEDKDVPAIPNELDLPDAFVYPLEAYYDSQGNQEWIGEVLPYSVTTLGVPDAGPVNDPSLLAFDSLVSLMSALGQDIATIQQLMEYASEDIDFPANRGFAGEPTRRLGTQQGSPSRLLNVGTQNMQPYIPAGGGGIQMVVEYPNQQTPDQDEIPVNELRLNFGNQDEIDNGDFRGRSQYPFYSPPESPEEEIPNVNDLRMNLENPSEVPPDVFDPIWLTGQVVAEWQGLVQDSGDLVQMADWNDIEEGMQELIGEANRLLQNGQLWVNNLVETNDRLVTAQQTLIAAIDAATAARNELDAQYEDAMAEIDATVQQYEVTQVLPTIDGTSISEQAQAFAEAAVQEFNAQVAPIDYALQTYVYDMNQNERDFSGFLLRTYRLLQRIENRLREIRRELHLDSPLRSPVLVNQQALAEEVRTDENGGGTGGLMNVIPEQNGEDSGSMDENMGNL
ncbi:hypothetical protein ABW21_db0200940 [Orbilia brochopaga]|nr:hypothetical protein ABW21_db0200940 [Drechslerella brochopaga]